MAGFDLDVSGLNQFADELGSAAGKLLEGVRPVVAKGALNVKTSMRADMAGSEHFKQVARSITYDTRQGVGWVEAEVGPVTEGATVGDLAHIAYFGGVRGGGGTVRDPQGNLDDEAANFEKALTDVVGDLL
jgi:hypothetical protein